MIKPVTGAITENGSVFAMLLRSWQFPLESSLDTFQEYFTIKSKILNPEITFSKHFNSYSEILKKTITNVNITNVEDKSKINKYIQYTFSPPQSD